MMQPELLGFLRDSFERFIQLNVVASSGSSWGSNEYQDHGLNAVFKSVFPIKTKDELCSLEYVSYNLEKPKYGVDECIHRGMTFAAPIKVVIRLVIWEDDNGQRMIRDVKEQEVYFGEIPLLTQRCTFIINGEERWIPSRLQRCTGVFFSVTEDGEPSAQLTSWQGQLSITKNKSGLALALHIPEQTLLSAVFLPTAKTILLSPEGQELYVSFDDTRPGKAAQLDLKTPSGDVIVAKKQRITAGALKKLRAAGVPGLLLSSKERLALFSAEDVFYGGELLLGKDRAVLGALAALQEKGVLSLRAYSLSEEPSPLLHTSAEDERSLLHWFESTFKFFDLSTVGRIQLNRKLSSTIDLDLTFLQRDDLSKIVERLHAMSRGSAPEDDPNHLGELQLHCVGEQLELHSWFGLTQMARAIEERLNFVKEREVMMPHDLINAKPLGAALRKLFSEGTDLIDQTNPLSILSQLRRVETPHEFAPHPTHKGMLSHGELALLCRPNEYLFLTSPYFMVEDGQSVGIEQLSAYEIERLIQSGAVLSPYRPIEVVEATSDPMNKARPRSASRTAHTLIGSSSASTGKRKKKPKQVELVACSSLQDLSLIEAIASNDTTARAMLAAPALYNAQPPSAHSSLSASVVQDAGCVVTSKASGEVAIIEEDRLWLSTGDPLQPLEVYLLRGMQPTVKLGQHIEAGALLADSLTSRGGELSLGREALVFSSCRFDAVRASSSLLRDFTSRHLIELECVVCDTRDGAEYLHREIPEVDAAHSAHLDEDGVIKLGTIVRAGDVLVGKYTPTLTGRVNSSLYINEGQHGEVTRVELFSRKGSELWSRRVERKHKERRERLQQKIESIQQVYAALLIKQLTGETNSSKLVDDKGALLVAAGAPLTQELLQSIPQRYLREIGLTDERAQQDLDQLLQRLDDALYAAEQEARSAAWMHDELPPGVIALVKVTIEQARPLIIGDTLTSIDGRAWFIEETFESSSSELLVPSDVNIEERLYLVKTTG